MRPSNKIIRVSRQNYPSSANPKYGSTQSSTKQHRCSLLDVTPNQRYSAYNGEDLKNFPGLSCSHLRLHVIDLAVSHRGESSSIHVLLHQGILLGPLLSKPQVELLRVVKWDFINAEPAPVKVDRLRRTALEVSAAKSEDVLAKLPASTLS